ncbi:hypothetical protein SmJEL517_g05878 [Synchytrium microbalum]|uniref:Uncharacterized protein n=1 Tax=Synchytrium microbalum TaxID=1806994 RepID=A0A507BZ15_9FUNG|nr:uncharacterized protein SmJEL517_g05878 [Synchytrium microbalum]TPX30585.1 hypothetical protein SmJEL517_g05878 [Synchytrium microbalum]
MNRPSHRDDMLLIKVESKGIRTNIALPPLVMPVSRKKRIILEADRAESDLRDMKAHLHKLHDQEKTLTHSVESKRRALEGAKSQSQLLTNESLSLEIQASKSLSDFQDLATSLGTRDVELQKLWFEWRDLVKTCLVSDGGDENVGKGVERVMEKVESVDNHIQRFLTRWDDKDSKFWFDLDSAMPSNSTTTPLAPEPSVNTKKKGGGRKQEANISEAVSGFLDNQESIVRQALKEDQTKVVALKKQVKMLQNLLDGM